MSEHTMHSSSDSMLLFRDGLRVPTCPLDRSEENNSVCVCERAERTANERLAENKWGSDDVNKEENMLPFTRHGRFFDGNTSSMIFLR